MHTQTKDNIDVYEIFQIHPSVHLWLALYGIDVQWFSDILLAHPTPYFQGVQDDKNPRVVINYDPSRVNISEVFVPVQSYRNYALQKIEELIPDALWNSKVFCAVMRLYNFCYNIPDIVNTFIQRVVFKIPSSMVLTLPLFQNKDLKIGLSYKPPLFTIATLVELLD